MTRTLAVERVARMAGNHSTALLTEVAKGIRDQAMCETGYCQECGFNPPNLTRRILDLCLLGVHDTRALGGNTGLSYKEKEET